MKRLVLMAHAFAAAVLLGAEEPLRNPFWPLGYEGVRHPISDTPRYPSTQTGDAEESALASESNATNVSTRARANSLAVGAENSLWQDARRTLRFGDTSAFSRDDLTRQVVAINGRLYETGDLLSVNSGALRFTWLVLGIGTNGTVRLQRMHRRELSAAELSNEE